MKQKRSPQLSSNRQVNLSRPQRPARHSSRNKQRRSKPPAPKPEQSEPAGATSAVKQEHLPRPPRPAEPPSRPRQPSRNSKAAFSAQRQLTVDVVDYDDTGRTTFSGMAQPGSRVRVYVSGRFTGEAQADDAGRWSLTPGRDIAAGTHALRADQVGGDGKVAQRIELPFLREQPERIAALQQQRKQDEAAASTAAQQSRNTQPQGTQAGARPPQPSRPAASGKRLQRLLPARH
jgi:hypothetical protein